MNKKPVAFITGAAQGIGLATAVEFARRGYDLALLDTKEPELALAARLVEEKGAAARIYKADLADLSLAETSIRQTVAHWGRIDALINNAAWREIKTMREISLESWGKNSAGMSDCAGFSSQMGGRGNGKKGRGLIINVSTIRTVQPDGMAPAYVAAKGGLDALTRELAVLLGPSNVRVVGISLGAVASGLSFDIVDRKGSSLTAQLRQSSEDNIPLKRWAKTEEAARVIALVASDDASYITGTTIVADGGWLSNGTPYSSKQLVKPEQFR